MTKIYLPRNTSTIQVLSQDGHIVIVTWSVQSRRVETTNRSSLGTFHCQLSQCKVSIVHQTIVTYSLFALTASTLRIKLLDVHWTLMYFHPSHLCSSLCVAPRSCQDSFVVFGAVNDLVIQTVQWCDVTSHPALTSHLSVEIWKIHPHRYLLRHYWLTDIYM